jgi:hypothetical protein
MLILLNPLLIKSISVLTRKVLVLAFVRKPTRTLALGNRENIDVSNLDFEC